ncbi:hypothetical protein [Nocardiopsis sp. CC223A]|uniref:hypothetical protein n=1 Tax=Nocardiopsis sp. CC223A TaxID=3044051 RepID=UPI00278C8859|nr:hypothetical protein [Nocardiopsis sp. CC223A]
MTPLVFDTGALIALERRDVRMWHLVQRTSQERRLIVISAGVYARVWRNDPRQHAIARLVKDLTVRIEPLDEEIARHVGALLARTGSRDVVDAHVALPGRLFRAPVLTSDPDDIGKLDSTLELIRV